jgi:capsular exopolysaccharide synthesis family protein
MKTTVLKLAGGNDFFTQESFKTLRTNVQFCGQDVRVVAVTSCHENEGKTVISLNLAKSFAELGKRVLVIDADMRKSVIAGRHTSAKRPAGLSEVLSGLVEVGECVYETQIPGLHLMFSGQYPPNPVELLSSSHFTKLVQKARESYDYVIVDTPPLGLVIDAAVIAPQCDGVMLVMANHAVRFRQAQEVVSQLEKSGAKILGVVRNNVGPKGNPYGKRYGKAYGKAYGKGYGQ